MAEPELLLLVLMLAVGGLGVLAGVVRVPYPILLVLGGLVLGFVPGVPRAELPPDLVLVLFLPPLLYQAAFFSSPRDLRADTRTITLLAVGLVLATMSAVAAVAIGLAVGWLLAEARRRVEDPVVEIVLSVVTGYAAYLPAELTGASGVLAAVTAGLYVGWRAPELASPSTRLLGFSFWEVLVYLLNAILFILVGLQLHPILSELSGSSV